MISCSARVEHTGREGSGIGEHIQLAFEIDSSGEGEGNRKLIPVRIPVAMLARIDHAANRLGLTRSGFIVLSAAERLTRMEGEFPAIP